VRPRDWLDWLAPPHCLACGTDSGTPLCDACAAGTPWRAPGDDAPPPGSGLAACRTLLWLEGPVVEWIHRFKYPRPGWTGLDPASRGLIGDLAQRLGERLDPAPGDIVVPVPLHDRRLRARGFNQAAFVAARALRRGRVPLATRALVRVRDTASQTGLSRSERLANVRGAFACPALPGGPGGRVWLVDDVVTTGATLAEAAAVLRAAGAGAVIGVGLARTPAAPQRVAGGPTPARGRPAPASGARRRTLG